ncbi:MAG: zinc dependent phospholipase C family protein [Desulfotignum sp.]|nr:zinc dependent phospholipase C family protein [Desulfotignum sp.]
MPKEISHWYLAGLVRENLPEKSVFYKPLHTHENLFFLGAVAPDIPFYYLLGPKKNRIQAASDPFHSPDARALAPVLSFFDSMIFSQPDPAALSLGAGIICHILSDTAFHPLVYYYSGIFPEHPGATARHRQFETALDLYFQHLAGPGARTCLGSILENVEVSKSLLLKLLGKLFNLAGYHERTCLGYAVRSQAFYQTLFRCTFLYRILHRMNQTRHRMSDSALSLIYPVKQGVALPFFYQKFQYQDPVTGRHCKASIPDLTRQVKRSGLCLLDMVSAKLAQQIPTGSLTGHPDLPEIRPGIPVCRFWKRQDNLLTNLYQTQG